MSDFRVPLFLRGEVIEEDWTRFGGRGRGIAFEAPDPAIHVERLPLASPLALADLYEISFDEILDVLEALGQALDFEKNEHVRKAYEAGLVATNYPASILKNSYATLPFAFDRESIRELAETRIGIDHLEGWVPRRLRDGRELRVRAFGARALHIPAGNGGLVSAITIIRNAITRSDAIIKVPSNDPLTAVAIARTLANVAPNHPLTKHLAVAYWKGGDEDVERRLFRPEHVEKVVAWGGFASVKHVTRYIQPGLEMIALDPKRSATIIGPEAFESEQTLDEVALRAACDIGIANQEACASARVIYVLCGSDSDGIAAANRLGERIYEKLQALPGRAGGLLATALGPGRQPGAGGRREEGHRRGERLHPDRGYLPREPEARAAGPAAVLRRPAADVPRLRLPRHHRHAPGRDRAPAPHV
jgi:hypothetical protein